MKPNFIWTNKHIKETKLPKTIKEILLKMNKHVEKSHNIPNPDRNPLETDGGYILIYDQIEQIVELVKELPGLEDGLREYEDEQGWQWFIGIKIVNNETSIIYVVSEEAWKEFNMNFTHWLNVNM
jgi:hypothetical protein